MEILFKRNSILSKIFISIIMLMSLLSCAQTNSSDSAEQKNEINKITLNSYKNTYDINESDEIEIDLTINPVNADLSDLKFTITNKNVVSFNRIEDNKLIFNIIGEGDTLVYLHTKNKSSNKIKLSIINNERIAQEKAEQDRIEQEKIAQAEQQRLEQEEQARKEAAEQKAQQESQQQQSQYQPPQQEQQSDPQGEVWIASSGKGTKYHKYSSCSNMKNPIKISISEAKARGYSPCKKCYK